jgi:hypothetical protein
MNIEWLVPIVLSLVAIILLFFLLRVKSKNKAIEEKHSKEAYNQVKGTKINIKTPKESLDSLNKLAKNFFKNYLNTKGELNYIEIAELLNKKNESSLADFCKKMDYYLYSGKEITKSEALEMVNNFILLSRNKKI